MSDVVIRKFVPADVEDFIRLSKLSFAEESVAAGITPEAFEHETRRIFRWKMIPYKLLAALMRVKWEGFVAETDGKVVGGGMYMGWNNRMSITNLMVDPRYRRQGIGQALLLRRLERLSECGFPYVTAQVLDTNIASLANLYKQAFEVFNQYSVYERSLPLPESKSASLPPFILRAVKNSDRPRFKAIEKRTTPPFVLSVNGSGESRFFLTTFRKMYFRYARYSKWIKALVAQGGTIGFVCADFHREQRKGLLTQPMITDECLSYLPAIIQKVGAWLEASGKESMIIEIPEERTQIRDYLLNNGWKKQYTWLELIKWLDERTRQKTMDVY